MNFVNGIALARNLKYDETRHVMHEKTIEDLLNTYKAVMGDDYLRYRNHVFRVYHNCLIIDSTLENSLKYATAVFHDIGIWTAGTFDSHRPINCHAAQVPAKTAMRVHTRMRSLR
jgi:hypothetical protein